MKKELYILCFAAMLLFAACSKKSSVESVNTYPIVSPVIMDTVYKNEYVADINAIQNVEIRTRINGYIDDVLVDEGQIVQKGQLLFKISNRIYLQDLQKAKATLQSAVAELRSVEIELENTQNLFNKKIVAESELEMIKAKTNAIIAHVAEAKSDEEQAELNLTFTEIRAPFQGTINRIPNKTGSLVGEGQLLTTLSDNREVFAYFNVSERDYLDYTSSEHEEEEKIVNLLLANNDIYAHTGVIETTDSEFDKHTGTISFRARFPNPNSLLKHGSSGKVQVKKVLKNVILIPQKSTFEVQENLYVFTVDTSNTVRLSRLIPSIRLPHFYVIASGITTSDRFIYEGIQRVREGEKIETETIQFSQVLKP